MSKVKLDGQDLERVLYWFHLAFKNQKPSLGDDESLLRFAECDIDLVQEEYDDPDEWYQNS